MITLVEGEYIVLEKRRYWLPIATQGFFLLLVAALPYVILAGIRLASPQNLLIVSQHYPFFLFLAATWVLILWVAFAIAWTKYYLDALIVTNKRLFYIEQKNLFARQVLEMRTEKIQDIRVEIDGFLPSLLHYGTLYIQAAGENVAFIFKDVPYPDKIKDVISKLYNELAQNQTPSSSLTDLP